MTGTIRYTVVSPESLVASGEAELVNVPGADGDFGVTRGHQPVISTIRAGVVRARPKASSSEGETMVFVRGGFAEAAADGVQVLAEEAEDLSNVAAPTEAELAAADTALKEARDDETRETARRVRERLIALRDALSG